MRKWLTFDLKEESYENFPKSHSDMFLMILTLKQIFVIAQFAVISLIINKPYTFSYPKRISIVYIFHKIRLNFCLLLDTIMSESKSCLKGHEQVSHISGTYGIVYLVIINMSRKN
jgi:hypothetical protein